MKKWILVLAIAVFIIAGCASAPIVKIDTVEVSNFVTFRSDPIGAEILVVDATTGKEVGVFGKTPDVPNPVTNCQGYGNSHLKKNGLDSETVKVRHKRAGCVKDQQTPL